VPVRLRLTAAVALTQYMNRLGQDRAHGSGHLSPLLLGAASSPPTTTPCAKRPLRGWRKSLFSLARFACEGKKRWAGEAGPAPWRGNR